MYLRADIRCKWTPFSLQGEHSVTTSFWIPDGSPLLVRLRVTENLLAIILIPLTVRTEDFVNLFVTLKLSRLLDKRKPKLGRSSGLFGQDPWRFNEMSHIIILPLLSIYMTFELNIKCLWQHPATRNHLEITKIEWREASDPIVITAHSLRQLETGKFPSNQGLKSKLISSQPYKNLRNSRTSKTLLL